ncbi:hypothetical protein KFL_000450260 [Klebsormidium nitens]|uniref:BTB domain-containing protein n=1 Tax=Klebsormidium nitens TaxID=105231 RepID=A0A1Y1HN59_KLENI|nr:hypothetical protein KFL_000450260 [Klebsormidium nitens]|eukprot:GAQ80070.1 hypothetical protein KFL_000450260 [Klebsormidium nitens]
MHEPLIDLEMQAVQDGDGALDEYGGWSYVQDIVVNTSVLAASSVYFRRMLTSGLQESLSNDRLIELKLFSHEAPFFNALIEFMHSQEIPPTIRSDKESLCWLLILADRIETPACIRKCVEHLMATPVCLADVVMCVNLPETVKRHPSVRVLMDAVCKYACWSFEDLAAAESIHTMDERSLKKIIASPSYGRHWSKDDIETLFAVCVEWFRHGSENRWEAFSALVLSFEVWRLQRSFIREICPEICTNKGQALLEKIEAGYPWRMKETKAAGIQSVDPDQLGILRINHHGKRYPTKSARPAAFFQ